MKVTITDKDCAEIAALGKYFPYSFYILCQFHALKGLDAFLTKKKNGAGDKEKFHDIRKYFRAVMYTESQDEFDSSKAYLTEKNKQLFHRENLLNLLIIQSLLCRSSFGKHWGIFCCQLVNIDQFQEKWINQEKWTNLRRRNLLTAEKTRQIAYNDTN